MLQLERKVEDPVVTPTGGAVYEDMPVRELFAEVVGYLLALGVGLVVDTDGYGQKEHDREG